MRIKHLAKLVLICALSASCFATNWYVDPAASGANNGTSWANAWTSVGAVNWTSVAAGDTVYLSGGTTSQAYSGIIGTPKSGAAGNPITISTGQDAGHNGTVMFNGGGTTSNFLSGNFSNVTITGKVGTATHMQLTNYNNTIWLCTGTCQNDKFEYVLFPSTGQGFDFHNGASVQGLELDHLEMHKINFSATSDFCITAPGTQGYPAHSVKIHDNKFYVPVTSGTSGIGDDGIRWLEGADVYDNFFKAVRVTYNGTQHPDMIQVGKASNLNIYNNTFEDVQQSLLYYDPNGSGDTGTASNVNVYNNLAYWTNYNHTGGARGFEFNPEGGATVTCSNFNIVNNTFVDWVNAAGGDVLTNAMISFHGFTGHSNCNVRNNAARNTTINFSGEAGVTVSNNVIGPIAFVNYSLYGGANNDLHLQSGDTIAKGKGVFISGIPAVDKDGTARPGSGAWDAGAYQSGGVVTPPPPNPPTGLTATPH